MTSEHFEKEMRTHNEEMTKTKQTVDTCKVHPKTKGLRIFSLSSCLQTVLVYSHVEAHLNNMDN